MAEKRKKPSKSKAVKAYTASMSDLTSYTQMLQIKKQFEKFVESHNRLCERLEDAEIQISLLTRLVTTLCIERLGMRVGVLKRLLKRIEKEAIRDSQILHLESIFNLPQNQNKKNTPSNKPSKYDPWEDIS